MHFQIFDCNRKYSANNYYDFTKKRNKKIKRIRFPPKTLTVFSGKEAEFDYKSNPARNNLTFFWIDIIGLINYKTSYVLYLIKFGVKKCPNNLEILCNLSYGCGYATSSKLMLTFVFSQLYKL